MARFSCYRLRPLLPIIIIISTLCYPALCQADNWEEYEDPSGFTVQHPPGWMVIAYDDAIHMVSPNGLALIYIDSFINMRNTVQQFIEAGSKFSSFGAPADDGVIRLINNDPNKGIGFFNYSHKGVPLKAMFICFTENGNGMRLSFFAPADEFEAKIELADQILGTLSFAGQDHPSISYVQWREPNEDAFTAEIPSQWIMTGGVMRWPKGKIGLNDGYKTVLRLTSPDGRILITNGDENIPVYFYVPNQVSQMSGFREGSLYSGALVMHYMTGKEYAEWYVANWLTNEYGYTDISFTEGCRDLPDKSRAINEINARYGLPSKSDYGEVYFTCRKGKEEMSGYYLASTEITSMPGSVVIWRAPMLMGYVAPKEEAGLAREVLAHLEGSIILNEIWMRAIIQNTAKVAELAQAGSQTYSEISDMVYESYIHRDRTYDNIQYQMLNFVNDRTDVRDPTTGTVSNVQGYFSHYWINPKTNTILGTDTNEQPGMNYHHLQEVSGRTG